MNHNDLCLTFALQEPDLLETILTVNNQTLDLAEQHLRRAMSQYTATHNTVTAAGAGGPGSSASGQRSGAASAEAALVKLTSGLADVAAKYATVRFSWSGGDSLLPFLIPLFKGNERSSL